ncbi:alcohol dehydrogenase [Alternaria panax]|uniref:Alcohol dehydrogenase n=1 Tax=Alternaria panax TaxID=48097 RepID=A0AAD4IJU5_9PLEO|nr:alcohol dehydrogenase [Alternaria panax]
MADCCVNAGWILGHTADGSQAEYVRINGILRGRVTPGCTAAIVRAGPVGLAAGLTAQLYSPRKLVLLDMDDYWLFLAREMDTTHVCNVKKMKGTVRDLAAEHMDEADGFDVVMEADSIPATFNMCQDLVAKGGHIANMGVHGKSVDLHVARLWARSPTISMALVSAHTILTLLELFAAGKIDASAMVTHDFRFSEIEKAYDHFRRVAETRSLKVSIEF